MGASKRRVLAALLLLLAVLGSVYMLGRARSVGSPEDKAPLMLMSSISLMWGEAGIADIAKGQAAPSPLYAHLSEQYRLNVIDDFQKLGRPGAVPLLLIQPRALAPRELVELDGWIRNGGKAIIFADPALDWPSDLPIGDQRRPLFTSLLTPMFRHWGVELALPVGADVEDKDITVDDYRLSPKSAGIWLKANGKASAGCDISEDQFLATCKVGKGTALLIADADVLYEEHWTGGFGKSGTIDWLDAIILGDPATAKR